VKNMILNLKERIQSSDSVEREFQSTVTEIIKHVREEGDDALRYYLKKFDKVDLRDFKITEDQIIEAKNHLPETLVDDIAFSVERIKSFAERQLETIAEFEQEMVEGVFLGQRVVPIESVGCYVPGGRYPLLSSAQMSIIPAKVAGVSKISVCSPPSFNGQIHPAILYAAHVSGADEIYSLGGAQAIAAMAYGTETVQSVNKITGPGNRFVTEAKRQVNGFVGIDLLAGPSEVLVLADETADPVYVASDLLAQAEHDVDARPILVSTSKKVAESVIEQVSKQLETLPTANVARESWIRQGEVITCDTLEEAIIVTNNLAPEHLHVQIKNPNSILNRLTNYGSLFLGENASVVYADKVCGTNHILPTNGAAKYTGGVWVGTFIKVITHQWIEDKGVQTLAPFCVRQSEREGLIGHLRSANIRLTGQLDMK
jgi:sulfopropanediol 3-dehydrogenase